MLNFYCDIIVILKWNKFNNDLLFKVTLLYLSTKFALNFPEPYVNLLLKNYYIYVEFH